MIKFPAVFRFHGQDELLYIDGHSDLLQHYQLHQSYFTPEDLLIDSNGQAYRLTQLDAPSGTGPLLKTFAQPELTAMVQAHFFALAQSCVTKIQAGQISTLFSLIQGQE